MTFFDLEYARKHHPVIIGQFIDPVLIFVGVGMHGMMITWWSKIKVPVVNWAAIHSFIEFWKDNSTKAQFLTTGINATALIWTIITVRPSITTLLSSNALFLVLTLPWFIAIARCTTKNGHLYDVRGRVKLERFELESFKLASLKVASFFHVPVYGNIEKLESIFELKKPFQVSFPGPLNSIPSRFLPATKSIGD